MPGFLGVRPVWMTSDISATALQRTSSLQSPKSEAARTEKKSQRKDVAAEGGAPGSGRKRLAPPVCGPHALYHFIDLVTCPWRGYRCRFRAARGTRRSTSGARTSVARRRSVWRARCENFPLLCPSPLTLTPFCEFPLHVSSLSDPTRGRVPGCSGMLAVRRVHSWRGLDVR